MFNLELKSAEKTCLIVKNHDFFKNLLDYYIQLIWNILENKLDFGNFQSNLDKFKYLRPNLSINSLFLSIFSKTQFFADNRLSSLLFPYSLKSMPIPQFLLELEKN